MNIVTGNIVLTDGSFKYGPEDYFQTCSTCSLQQLLLLPIPVMIRENVRMISQTRSKTVAFPGSNPHCPCISNLGNTGRAELRGTRGGRMSICLKLEQLEKPRNKGKRGGCTTWKAGERAGFLVADKVVLGLGSGVMQLSGLV